MKFSILETSKDLKALCTGQKTVAFIIAGNKNIANSCCETWGWKYRGVQGYISLRGELVYYISDDSALYGVRGKNIYLGYKWHESIIGASLRASPSWAKAQGLTFIVPREIIVV